MLDVCSLEGAVRAAGAEFDIRRPPIDVRVSAHVGAEPIAVRWRSQLEREVAMSGKWVITDTDVRALLEVFERCEPAAEDDIFYADVLSGLRVLIPCDDISFQLMDVAEQRITC